MAGVGDAFTMSLHNAEMGDCEITNHVVEYECNRRIGWEPYLSAESRAEDQADIAMATGGSMPSEPLGPSTTVVTEIYDCATAIASTALTPTAKSGSRPSAGRPTTLGTSREPLRAAPTGSMIRITRAACNEWRVDCSQPGPLGSLRISS